MHIVHPFLLLLRLVKRDADAKTCDGVVVIDAVEKQLHHERAGLVLAVILSWPSEELFLLLQAGTNFQGYDMPWQL